MKKEVMKFVKDLSCPYRGAYLPRWGNGRLMALQNTSEPIFDIHSSRTFVVLTSHGDVREEEWPDMWQNTGRMVRPLTPAEDLGRDEPNPKVLRDRTI
jgi:hypothetical protein